MVPERERILLLEQLFTKQISNSQSTLLYSSVRPCTSSYWRYVSFFTSTTVNQTDSAVRWAEPTNTANPTMGRVTNITTPEKRTYFVTGQRSTGGYPERERTFSQKHSVKRRRINELLASTCPIIKRPAISYVLLKHHKTLNSFKAMIDVHKRTSFLEFTVCFSLQCEFW